MSYNAKKLIAKATSNITRDVMKFQKLAMEKYQIKAPPKPTFTKLEQIKEIETKRQLQSVLNIQIKSYPADILWRQLERKAIIRQENTCIICFDVLGRSDVLIASCGHFYHKKCIEATKTRVCPCCKQEVYFQISETLQKFSVKLCTVYIQKSIRAFLGRKKRNARKIIKSGVFAASVNEVINASERLTSEIHSQLEIEYLRAKNDADETDRLFEEIMKMRSVKGYEVLEKARNRKNYLCAVCLDEVDVKLIKIDEEGQFALSSCCGSLYHWDCICAAEKEKETCPYCRGGFYKVRISIF
ncbi:RING-like zinc finger domain-containing protein [Spironucleus salmonicida]|uniref:RING-like zinc finger domain-containing protein n=1 Tax=Spironucleus salmonicida TaxID=348837 RepID=V6LC71_9EUKA|nr:RING-like zinc finger domain-containing protein [Spironucleus salmonicida]|eukprot:EST42067.1 hypothetical protein SS50377_18374 [Spironucleus salmonicida]